MLWILHFLNGIHSNKLPNKKSNRKEEEKSQSKEKKGRKQEQVYLSFFKRRVRQAVQDKGGGAYRHRKEKETP